jgi:hypothetical protein
MPEMFFVSVRHHYGVTFFLKETLAGRPGPTFTRNFDDAFGLPYHAAYKRVLDFRRNGAWAMVV